MAIILDFSIIQIIIAIVFIIEEDLDLRVLPMTSNKRQSTDVLQSSAVKKSKTEEIFDE